MRNKFDMRIMPLGDIYKFYGRCYHINDQNFEIETDVRIEHVAIIEEAVAIQSEFISKNTPEEVILQTPIIDTPVIEEPVIEAPIVTDTNEEITPTENI